MGMTIDEVAKLIPVQYRRLGLDVENNQAKFVAIRVSPDIVIGNETIQRIRVT
jgi:hypothetical protein